MEVVLVGIFIWINQINLILDWPGWYKGQSWNTFSNSKTSGLNGMGILSRESPERGKLGSKTSNLRAISDKVY